MMNEKTAASKGHILHGYIYVTFSDWQTVEMKKEIMVSQG